MGVWGRRVILLVSSPVELSVDWPCVLEDYFDDAGENGTPERAFRGCKSRCISTLLVTACKEEDYW